MNKSIDLKYEIFKTLTPKEYLEFRATSKASKRDLELLEQHLFRHYINRDFGLKGVPYTINAFTLYFSLAKYRKRVLVINDGDDYRLYHLKSIDSVYSIIEKWILSEDMREARDIASGSGNYEEFGETSITFRYHLITEMDELAGTRIQDLPYEEGFFQYDDDGELEISVNSDLENEYTMD